MYLYSKNEFLDLMDHEGLVVFKGGLLIYNVVYNLLNIF